MAAAVWKGEARRTSRSGFVALVCALPVVLGGCLDVRTPEEGAPVRATPGEGLVFGRIRVFERGLEITPWQRELTEIALEDPEIRLHLFHVDSGRKRPNVPLASDGGFEWILPAGTYLLYHTPSVDPPFNEPLAAFQVVGGSDPVDLGELRLGVSVDRSFSARLATYTLAEVEAAAGDAATTASFLARHPGTSAVHQGAFVVDPELGGLFAFWSRDACARILRRHGMEL